MQDEGMSREERLGNVSACPYKADKEIREILNDENRSLNLQLWLGHLLIGVTYRPRSLSVYFPRLGQGEGADQNLRKDAVLRASAPAVPSSTCTWRTRCSGTSTHDPALLANSRLLLPRVLLNNFGCILGTTTKTGSCSKQRKYRFSNTGQCDWLCSHLGDNQVGCGWQGSSRVIAFRSLVSRWALRKTTVSG